MHTLFQKLTKHCDEPSIILDIMKCIEFAFSLVLDMKFDL